MSQSDDLVTRPWVVAIALASLLAGVFIQQIFFALTLGPLISNPTNPNGDDNGNGNQTTTIPLTTTPTGVTHFQIIPDAQTGNNYKEGYYKESEQYYLRFFDITIRESGGSSGTVIIRCLVEDKYGNNYSQEFHETFNARQEKILEFKIAISTTVWSNDEIDWASSSVTLLGEY